MTQEDSIKMLIDASIAFIEHDEQVLVASLLKLGHTQENVQSFVSQAKLSKSGRPDEALSDEQQAVMACLVAIKVQASKFHSEGKSKEASNLDSDANEMMQNAMDTQGDITVRDLTDKFPFLKDDGAVTVENKVIELTKWL